MSDERCDTCAHHGAAHRQNLVYCWRFMHMEPAAYHCVEYVDEAAYVSRLIGVERKCGDCVVFNGSAGPGTCSVFGARDSEQAACRRWFPKTQLQAPLYGH